MKATVTVTVIIGVIFIAVCTYFSRRWIPKRRGNMLTDGILAGYDIFRVVIQSSLTTIL